MNSDFKKDGNDARVLFAVMGREEGENLKIRYLV